MKLFFTQPEFDGQLLRALTYVPVGGADIGECLTTAAKIKEGDFDSWHHEWTSTADRLAGEAEAALQGGHTVSACEAFLRASNYYRTAPFFLGGSPVDPRVAESYERHAATFESAVNLLPYAVERVNIRYGSGFLTGYFYKTRDCCGPRATVITFPGYDGTQQECYFSIGKSALDRGFNVLCIDGPGQGDLLINQQIYMTPEWELVVKPAVDFLLGREDVAADAIALIGTSWGGMLAPLAAAKERRIAALVANPGQYDALTGIKKALPQIEDLLQDSNYAVLDQILKQILADKMIAAKFKYKMWVHGVDSANDLIKAWTRFSLADLAPEIACPTLIIDSENEPFSSGQAKLLYDALTCPKEYILCKNSEGAGEHCSAGALTLVNHRIFDWLEATLDSKSFVGAPS